jgi:uncharacterized membrane protein YphA (DoxX/SURF4 family)
VALGLIGLWSGDFAAVWQPVPVDFPARSVFACGTAIVLLASGALLQWQRAKRFAALALGLTYGVFATLWIRRVVGHPEILATWSGCAEQVALVLGAAIAVVSASRHVSGSSARTLQALRIAFGLCVVVFALAHFRYVTETAAMVPGWLPPSARFWALATGVAHLMAGIALLSGVFALLAARCLTVMFVIFGLLVWLPRIVDSHRTHFDWAGNGINLALIGAAWVLADALTSTQGHQSDAIGNAHAGR